MATLENEIVSVDLPDGTRRDGVVYTIDPEEDWVTVIARGDGDEGGDGDGEKRLVIVRRACVTFTGRISTDIVPIMENNNSNSNSNTNVMQAGEVVKQLNLRRMEAALDADGGTIRLLDGSVEIRAPYGEKEVSCTNETIAARVAAVLREIRGGAQD